MKWGFLPPPDGGPRYLVVNADESEPGTCKDIPLLMAAPHFLVEGVAITSFAIGCNHAFIYLRGEVVHVYPAIPGLQFADPRWGELAARGGDPVGEGAQVHADRLPGGADVVRDVRVRDACGVAPHPFCFHARNLQRNT